MAAQAKLKSRYEIRETLGQGGMGVVYRAYDSIIRREVALKTIRDTPEAAALETFYKECGVLASMAHPNIIEIFDLGEFEENGVSKPYFVMPLLPGATLESLIRSFSQRLTVERAVEIIAQTCRGLQAAHERGLVHRDLKPSNIFVMEDDSVKIIDFGVAHIVDTRTTMGLKGTLAYMAPEQIEMKPLSALSDIFSLGVVAYETLTLRRPFQGRTQAEIVEAILHYSPPPASDFNPAVSQKVSQVIHKSMAKQPWHRFASAREFAEILQKAARNETLEIFDLARIQPRIQRAAKAFEQGDFQFASEILSELEAEGHIDPAISALQRQIEQTMRQKTVAQLLRGARTRLEEREYPLALQKLQEVLQLDPENAEALNLRSSLEGRRTEEKIEDWFRLARQHIENYDFSHAREALQNVLQLRPQETTALQLLSEVGRREQEYLKVRQKKQELYQVALQVWQNGDVSAALSKLQEVLELDRRAPDLSAAESGTLYQNFYNQVRSEHDAINHAYAEARRHLSEKNFTAALALCSETLAKYPSHALFQALKFDIEEQRRQELSGQIAEINRRVEAEPDLDRRVSILKEAAERYPGEAYFEPALRLMCDKRDLVNSIVAKARLHEEQSQYNEALAQWEIVRSIYSPYPGLNFEIERLVKRREQQARSAAKARWVEQIDLSMETGDWAAASEALRDAEAEFPGDAELAELAKLVHQGQQRAEEAQQLLARGQQLFNEHKLEEGLEVLTRAQQLDDRSPVIRAVLVNTLVEHARGVLDRDWRAAEPLILRALDLEPANHLAQSLRTLAADCKREEFVDRAVSQARQAQLAGDLKAAIAIAEQGLAAYPNEFRLAQLMSTLNKGFEESRRRSLEELRHLSRDSQTITDPEALGVSVERARKIASQYSGDVEFQTVAATLEQRQLALTSTFAGPLAVGSGARIAQDSSHPLAQLESARPAVYPGGNPPDVEPVKPQAMVRQEETLRSQGAAAQAVSDSSMTPAESELAEAAAKPIPAAVALGRRFLPRIGLVAALPLLAGLVFWFSRLKQEPAPSSVPLTLEVRTTPSGARVIVDGESRGISNLALSLAPGSHQIRVELDGYEPSTVATRLDEGVTPEPLDIPLKPLVGSDAESGPPLVSLPAPAVRSGNAPTPSIAARSTAAREELPLKPTNGILHLRRVPANAQVSIQGSSESQPRPVAEDRLELLEGSYTLTATASGYAKFTTPVNIEGGKVLDLDVSLQPAKESPEDWRARWENPRSWTVEGDWLVHRGGNFVLSSLPAKPGSYSFTLWRKGKSPQWVVNYRDNRNYILFELDRKSLSRLVVRNGKKGSTIKIAHSFEGTDIYPLQVSITEGSIVHRMYDGSKWVILDELKLPGSENFVGRFGFFVPGKDELFLSHFSFKPL